MTFKQLSVFIENKVGRLSEITAILQENAIDIRALSLADTTKFGILRLIVNKPELAQQALKQAGMTVSLTNVIAIGVNDAPGGLAKVVTLLGDKQIDIEYMYAFISREKSSAYVIMRVEDNDRAIATLTDAGVPLMRAAELYGE